MNYKTGLLIIIFFVYPASGTFAQLPRDIVESIEDLLPEGEESEDHEIFLEHFSELFDNPLNINLADRTALEGSLLFSPFQVYQLMNYRQRYGDFYSIYELNSIPGFNEQKLKSIEPFVCFNPVLPAVSGHNFKYRFMTDIKTVYPFPAGYLPDSLTGETVYAGLNFRLLTRFRADLDNRFLLGITLEKDPGETFLLNHLPQFLSGYLEFRKAGPFVKIIAGTYRLQSGLGLVTGTGFNPSPENYNLNGINPIQLKAYASSSEYNYFTGIAANCRIRNLESIVWLSHNFRDLSLAGYTSGTIPVSWEPLFRETGLHRTTGEINGSRLAFEESAGIMINRKFQNLVTGGVFLLERTGLTRNGADSLSIIRNPSGLHPEGGISLLWFDRKSSVFFEMALSGLWDMAFLGGARHTFNDYLSGAVLFRHYDTDYAGLQPSAYSLGSRLQNETGPVIILNIHPFRNTTLKFYLDFCRFPGIKKDVGAPGWSGRYKIDLQHDLKILSFRFYLSSRQWPEKGINPATGISPINFIRGHHVRLQSTLKIASQFTWTSRLELSFSTQKGKSGSGSIMYHEISGQMESHFSFKARYTLFHVEDWENRIYCYEPGLLYNFPFPVHYGIGSKFAGLLQVKILKDFRVGLKTTVTFYEDRDTVGSGYDLISGNRKLEIWIQVIWKN